jgi:hypothetical protein
VSRFSLVICFAQTTKPNQVEDTGGPSVSQVGSSTMQIIRLSRLVVNFEQTRMPDRLRLTSTGCFSSP